MLIVGSLSTGILEVELDASELWALAREGKEAFTARMFRENTYATKIMVNGVLCAEASPERQQAIQKCHSDSQRAEYRRRLGWAAYTETAWLSRIRP